MRKIFTLALALGVAAPAFAGTKYKFDQSKSKAGFTVSHLMIGTAEGGFKKFKGSFDLDLKAPEKSSVEAEFDVRTIDTANQKRDKHLNTEDFFFTEKYPTATFKSGSVVKGAGAGEFTVYGDLSIRGVTKPVTLTAKLALPEGGKAPSKLAFEAGTVINRMDFGVAWNNKNKDGKAMLGDEVTLKFSGEAKKK